MTTTRPDPSAATASATGPRRTTARAATRSAGIGALLAAVVLIAGCASSGTGGASATSAAGSAASSAVPQSGAAGASAGGGTGTAGGSGSAGGSAADGGGNSGRNGGAAGAGPASRPGASGTVAAVQAGSFEVQDSTSQTTVRYTSTTDIQRTVAATLSAVTVGACITAVDAAGRSGTGSGGAAGSGAPGTGGTGGTGSTSGTGGTGTGSGQRGGFPGRGTPRSITATTVSVQPAVKGSCATGFGGGRGAFPRGTGAAPARPTGGAGQTGATGPSRPARTGAGRGNGSGFAGFGGIVAGKVAAVHGSTITVTVTELPGRTGGTSGAAAPSTGAAAPTTPTTTTSTVTVTGKTTYSATATATPAQITVGLCASAFGPADDTGAITATEIRLSAETNGSCFAGFGRAGGFGGARQGGSGSGGSPAGGTGAPVTTHG